MSLEENKEYKSVVFNTPSDLVFDNVWTKEEVKDHDKWTGVVVNNNDPSRLGRVKVKIIGIYDDVDEAFIPWAIPDIGYIGSSKGSMIIPETGTFVRGYFDQGDLQKPIYDGVAFNAENYETSLSDRSNPTEYPHKMVLMETDQGDFLTLNRKTGNLVFMHRTGASFKIDPAGNIEIITGSTNNPGKLNVSVRGSCNITSNGNVNLTAGKNVDIKSTNGEIRLGNNLTKQLINNLPSCLICGAPHCVGNTQVKV